MANSDALQNMFKELDMKTPPDLSAMHITSPPSLQVFVQDEEPLGVAAP